MTRVRQFGPFLVDLDMLQRSGQPPTVATVDPWGRPVIDDDDIAVPVATEGECRDRSEEKGAVRQ
jgi:hypothetical protein